MRYIVECVQSCNKHNESGNGICYYRSREKNEKERLKNMKAESTLCT